MTTLHVALDLWREAASRKWFLGLAVGLTLLLVVIASSLELEVVDGALAASKLFGDLIASTDIRAADVALRPVFAGAAYVIFYGGLVFGVLSTADFAPSLLSPGRIEHLLSLPVRRWELIAGTFVGVLGVALAGALYASGGFTLILGVKTGVWTPRLVGAALLAVLSFATVYGAMLAAAMFARSAAVSGIAGLAVLVLGIVAGKREVLAPMFEPGLRRSAFEAVTRGLPPLSSVADLAAGLAGTEAVDPGALVRRLTGVVVFGLALLLVGVWRFDTRDF